MRNFLTFAGVAQLCIVVGGLALAAGGAAADDETFRPFPREEILLPAELGRLLSNLPRNAPTPTGSAESPEALPDGALPQWMEQLRPLVEEAMRKQRAETQPSPREPSEAPGERREIDRQHSEPSPERSEGRRQPRDAEPDAERPPSRDGPSRPFPSEPRLSSDPQFPSDPRRPGASPPADVEDRRPATPPQPQGRREFNWPPSDDPRRSDDRPRITPPPSPANIPPANVAPAAAEEQTSSPPRPARNSRKEFSEALNKIVYEAAQQAARPEVAEAVAGATSRESFLNPVVTRMRELLAKRRGGWRPERSWARDERKIISDAARRVSGAAAALPEAPSDETLRGAAGTARQVVAPALFLLAILLLIPLWRRYGERLTALLKRSSPRILLPVRRVDSPADLVQAVDRFLAAQFGRAADWWHCRAVERALTRLAPELSGDIARLAAAYELSRYGPASHPVSRYDLERSTATLRRLAEGQATGRERSR
jgi:hypothetical protein